MPIYHCSCKPKKGGCAHRISKKGCRLLSGWGGSEKCIMGESDYHYLCCPFLNSTFGQSCLDLYVKEKEG